jgi:hypothetical protein
MLLNAVSTLLAHVFLLMQDSVYASAPKADAFVPFVIDACSFGSLAFLLWKVITHSTS